MRSIARSSRVHCPETKNIGRATITLERAPIVRAAPSAVTSGHVVLAAAITLVAGLVEMAVARHAGSRFLQADAVHLLAHLAIFTILLLPAHGARAARREDGAACAVLVIVLVLGAGMATDAIEGLLHPSAPPAAAAMLVSLFGLGANLASAALLRGGSRRRMSFRAALTHELADGSLTVVALGGAVLIAYDHVTWVDPTLSLLIAGWLLSWAVRLLAHRWRHGWRVWRTADQSQRV